MLPWHQQIAELRKVIENDEAKGGRKAPIIEMLDNMRTGLMEEPTFPFLFDIVIAVDGIWSDNEIVRAASRAGFYDEDILYNLSAARWGKQRIYNAIVQASWTKKKWDAARKAMEWTWHLTPEFDEDPPTEDERREYVRETALLYGGGNASWTDILPLILTENRNRWQLSILMDLTIDYIAYPKRINAAREAARIATKYFEKPALMADFSSRDKFKKYFLPALPDIGWSRADIVKSLRAIGYSGGEIAWMLWETGWSRERVANAMEEAGWSHRRIVDAMSVVTLR